MHAAHCTLSRHAYELTALVATRVFLKHVVPKHSSPMPMAKERRLRVTCTCCPALTAAGPMRVGEATLGSRRQRPWHPGRRLASMVSDAAKKKKVSLSCGSSRRSAAWWACLIGSMGPVHKRKSPLCDCRHPRQLQQRPSLGRLLATRAARAQPFPETRCSGAGQPVAVVQPDCMSTITFTP